MQAALRQSLATALGAQVSAARAVSGGDINDAYRVELSDGRIVFVKANTRLTAQAFEAEARGLHWLGEAAALRVPTVLAVAGPTDAVPFLALEWLDSGTPRRDFDEVLGRGLATLHLAGAAGFGFTSDNTIGSLPQANGALLKWSDFYRERRLLPQLNRAASQRALPAATLRRTVTLLSRLGELCGPEEPPARLHGDLWSGNLHIGPHGEPCLIDPACYGGHREVDLAMMRLFGGFGPRVFDAYATAYPLASGHSDRVALYQLYPLLVHVNLFGGGYAASFERALSSLGF